MNRTTLLGFAAIVLLLTSCATGMNLGSRRSLDGTWELDAGRSDTYGRLLSDEFGGYGDDAVRYRGWRLPDVVRIDADGDRVRIEDQDGRLVEEIVVEDTDWDRYERRPGTTHARWRGDQLEVHRTNRNERSIVQVFTLRDDGRELLVETEITGGERRDRNIRRVYERA